MTLLLQILAVLAFLAAWGFIIMGMVMNAQVWWIALHAKEGDQIPSGVTFIFGLLGAGLVWMTLSIISKIKGAEVPWFWAWVALPLFLDVYCLGALVLALFGFARKVEPVEPGKEPGDGPSQAPEGAPDPKQDRGPPHGQN
jgi:hypothetical protein